MSDETTVADDLESVSQTTDQKNGAQVDNLDTLLANYDKEFDQKTTPETKPDDARVMALETTVNTLLAEKASTDINNAISTIQKELSDSPVKLPDHMIDDILNGMASKDKRFLNAFRNRANDPAGWNGILKATAEKLKKDFHESNRVDEKITGDREAVAAVIRGSKTVALKEEVPDFNTMTDSQFEYYKRTGKQP